MTKKQKHLATKVSKPKATKGVESVEDSRDGVRAHTDTGDTPSVVLPVATFSSSKLAPTNTHKLRNVMAILLAVLIIATAGWVVREYKHYHDMHTPERQAALFKTYNDTVIQLHNLRHYGPEIATIQGYLATKPDAQYRDKATLKLATAQVAAGNYDEAITSYRSLESKADYRLDVWRGLSAAYAAKGDSAQARAYLQKTIQALNVKGDPVSKLQTSIDQVQVDAYQQ